MSCGIQYERKKKRAGDSEGDLTATGKDRCAFAALGERRIAECFPRIRFNRRARFAHDVHEDGEIVIGEAIEALAFRPRGKDAESGKRYWRVGRADDTRNNPGLAARSRA